MIYYFGGCTVGGGGAPNIVTVNIKGVIVSTDVGRLVPGNLVCSYCGHCLGLVYSTELASNKRIPDIGFRESRSPRRSLQEGPPVGRSSMVKMTPESVALNTHCG